VATAARRAAPWRFLSGPAGAATGGRFERVIGQERLVADVTVVRVAAEHFFQDGAEAARERRVEILGPRQPAFALLQEHLRAAAVAKRFRPRCQMVERHAERIDVTLAIFRALAHCQLRGRVVRVAHRRVRQRMAGFVRHEPRQTGVGELHDVAADHENVLRPDVVVQQPFLEPRCPQRAADGETDGDQ